MTASKLFEMDVFFVDKVGNNPDAEDDDCNVKEEHDNGGDTGFMHVEESDLFDKSLKIQENKLNEISFSNTYLITSYKNLSNEEKNSFSNLNNILENSVIKPGLEKQIVVPPERSKKFLKKEKKKLNKMTKGKQWFDMPATELTKDVVTDFKLLKMRSVLDRKHVYKKNDITRMPKYFQVGKVVESAADFYGGRIPKSQRKKTFVDDLLADAEFQKYQKKKFKEIMDGNRRKKQTKKNFQENKKHRSKQKLKDKNYK